MDKFTKTTEIDISAMNEMEDETPKKSSVGKIVAMVLCLILAIVIWFVVMEVDTSMQQRTFENISVEIVGGEGYSIQGDLVVDVVFIGTNKNLARINEKHIRATLDLSKVNIDLIGQKEYPVSITFSEGFNSGIYNEIASVSLKIVKK